jgi:hypothetical protein
VLSSRCRRRNKSKKKVKIKSKIPILCIYGKEKYHKKEKIIIELLLNVDD